MTATVYVGTVLTQDPSRPEAEAVAVRDGRIVAVGDVDTVLRDSGSARRVDLGDHVLLPGFHDAHTHFAGYGVQLLRLDLSRATSRADVLQAVTERAKMTPEGGWVVGYGWDESHWDDAVTPTRRELDDAAPANPVLLMRVDMHSALVNTKAAEHAVVDARDGWIVEDDAYAVHDAVTPHPTTIVKGVQHGTRVLWSMGVTSVHAIVDRRELDVLRDLHARGDLGLRVGCYVREPDAYADDLLRGGDAHLAVHGVKLFTDGSIGSHTAAIHGHYADGHEGHGDLVYPQDALDDLVARAVKKGLQPALHAIGDAAVDAALHAFDALDARPGALRPRIEHAELTTDGQVERMRELGVVASMQPNFIGEWGHPGQMYAKRLGDDVVAEHNRLRVLLDAGIPLAFGSDHMPTGPLYGVHCAVNAPTDAQRLTVDEALAAYTRGSAYAAFEEDAKGVVAPGRLADLVVLDEDPRRAPAQVRDRQIVATILGGRVVHALPGSPVRP